MKTRSSALCAAVSIMMLLAVGCGSKEAKAQRKLSDLLGEYADVLSGIKSNSDFVSAKPKLEKLSAKMQELVNARKALPAAAAEKDAKLAMQSEADSKKATDRIATEMERLEKIGVPQDELMQLMSTNQALFSH